MPQLVSPIINNYLEKHIAIVSKIEPKISGENTENKRGSFSSTIISTPAWQSGSHV